MVPSSTLTFSLAAEYPKISEIPYFRSTVEMTGNVHTVFGGQKSVTE